MPQSIQPIRDAISRGDRHEAVELIKQALAVDPRDIDVLLALAAIVEEPASKLQILNRIFAVAPTHKAARAMLLDMDWSEMSAHRSQPGTAPVSQLVAQLSTLYPSDDTDLQSARPQRQMAGVATPAAPSARPAQAYEVRQPTTRLDSPAFTGTNSFRRGFLKQFGNLFLLLPISLVFAWFGYSDIRTRAAFFVAAGFCALLMLIPFFQVRGLKVEPDKLTIQTFFEEKEFSAHEIREIKMQSVHGRYGRVTNFVSATSIEGKRYSLSGLAESDEILYGFLINWWNRYRVR